MKKIILSICTIVIIAITAFNIHLNVSKDVSSLKLANVQALAGFEFNGTQWDTGDHWYNWGGDWKPVLIACTASPGSGTFTVSTGGSINIVGIGGFSWNGVSFTYNGGTTSYNGAQVQCQGGNGNCINGTQCYGASIL